jgi:hypothetical protein
VKVTVGCVKYPEPSSVIVTVETFPLTIVHVAAACVPPAPVGAEIVIPGGPVYPSPTSSTKISLTTPCL